MAIKILERQLSDIWRRQSFQGTLLTENGEKLEIVYPGRINDNRGGDFCDAVIAFSDRTLMGDVELHVRSGDWRSHGHHLDPSYNKVILHVVHACNAGATTVLENGGHVPVLALKKYLRKTRQPGKDGKASGRPCSRVLARLGKMTVSAALEQAGDERFVKKDATFSEQLKETEPGQVLYQGVMTALGYSKNKLPFLKLSQHLPLAGLQALGPRGGSDAEFQSEVETFLLEAAGLNFEYADGHHHRHQRIERIAVVPMVVSEWELLRARPQNNPRSRLMAMSHLLTRYRKQGLLRGLMSVVEEAPLERLSAHFEAALMVASDARSGECGSLPERSLLGQERAADIVVNVLLPFASAFGRAFGPPELSRKAVFSYCGWPRLGTNCLERHMTAQTGLTRETLNSARRQQGLIEIYSTLCKNGRCRRCGLGQP